MSLRFSVMKHNYAINVTEDEIFLIHNFSSIRTFSKTIGGTSEGINFRKIFIKKVLRSRTSFYEKKRNNKMERIWPSSVKKNIH